MEFWAGRLPDGSASAGSGQRPLGAAEDEESCKVQIHGRTRCRNVHVLTKSSPSNTWWVFSEHMSHLEQYINSMEKLSVNCHSNGEAEIGSAFCRLADLSKEFLSPMKNLVSHISTKPEVTWNQVGLNLHPDSILIPPRLHHNSNLTLP